jgi:hypothetical protein
MIDGLNDGPVASPSQKLCATGFEQFTFTVTVSPFK